MGDKDYLYKIVEVFMYFMFILIGISGVIGALWLLTVPLRDGADAITKANDLSQVVGFLFLVALVLLVIAPRARKKLRE